MEEEEGLNNNKSPKGVPVRPNVSKSPARKKGWPRGRKRRIMPKDAPKAPLSGYMIFMGEQRDMMRLSPKPPTFSESAKLCSVQWAALHAKDKQRFLDQADQDKERYSKEIEVYKQSSAYQNFMEEQNLKEQELNQPATPSKATSSDPKRSKAKKSKPEVVARNVYKSPVEEKPPHRVMRLEEKSPGKASLANVSLEGEMVNYGDELQVPIFTDQFLRHNKAREAELRQLRKMNTDYEEHNALISQTIQTIEHTVQKFSSETEELERKNEALEQHLRSLRQSLYEAFTATPLPGWDSPASVGDMDDFLCSLHSRITASPPAHTDAKLQHTVAKIVTDLCSAQC